MWKDAHFVKSTGCATLYRSNHRAESNSMVPPQQEDMKNSALKKLNNAGAFSVLTVLLGMILLFTIKWKVPTHLALFFGWIFLICVGFCLKWRYSDLEDVIEKVEPMKAVFDKKYVKKLDGEHVKKAATKYDQAQRSGMKGIQEWLSFYFKSPMCAPEIYPEHDLFIQLMKLKNTLRYLKGEELITHLGLEYYD